MLRSIIQSKKLKMILFLLSFILSIPIDALEKSADLLIFSFDRPIQLYALLESIKQRLTGINHISVLYRTSTIDFEKAYSTVKEAFPYVTFKCHEGKHDFQKVTRDIISNSKTPYMFFGVDDIIVTDECDITQCTQMLEETGAYCFFLRLGKNITHCYTVDIACQYPYGIYAPPTELMPVNEKILKFNFAKEKGEWNYPHTVDMTIYRKETVLSYIETDIPWVHPNNFEGSWSLIPPARAEGLCFVHSKIINIPMNVVNVDWESRNMKTYDIHTLLKMFNEGYRINIDTLYKFLPPAPHFEYQLTFIKK